MILSKITSLIPRVGPHLGPLRHMSDVRKFPMQPSRWQWMKFKDVFHFYVLLGVIPCGLFLTWANIFIGPATLTEIPEGYTPEYWEYHRHPVSRMIAKYIGHNPQQDYEKYLCYLYFEQEKIMLRKLEREVKQKLAERNDYQAYYFRPVMAKYHRIAKESYDEIMSRRGDH